MPFGDWRHIEAITNGKEETKVKKIALKVRYKF